MRDEWQPIETAPKDGTRILTNSGVGIRIVRWVEDRGFDHGPGWCVANTICHPRYDAIANATGMKYWHPLPSPPTVTPALPEAEKTV